MGWATIVTSDALTLTASWQIVQESAADMEISHKSKELAHVQVECDFEVTPADNAEFKVETSPDGGTTWDTDPAISGELDNGVDPARVAFNLAGIHTWRMQMKQTGATDTSNAGKVRVRLNGEGTA